MIWEFAILDRNANEFVIDEPEGWDGMKIVLKRDDETHGIVTDYQLDDFVYRGLAFTMIKNEYLKYGIEGDLTLIIRQDCGKGKNELYRGKMLFVEYEDECGSDCFCKIPVETTGEIMKLINRWDQGVNLETTTAFDEYTVLQPYEWLGKKMELPGKSIFMQNDAKLSEPKEVVVKFDEINYTSPPSVPDVRWAWINITLPLDVQDLSEFGNFATTPDINNTFPCHGTNPVLTGQVPCGDTEGISVVNKGGWNSQGVLEQWVILDWATMPPVMWHNPERPNNLEFINGFKLHVSYSGQYERAYDNSTFMHAWHHVIAKKKVDGSIEVLDQLKQVNSSTQSQSWGSGNREFSYNRTLDNVTLERGEYLFVFIGGLVQLWTGFLTPPGNNMYKVRFNNASIKAEAMSFYRPTKAKVFMANEAFSRVTEAVTDGAMKAYSEYFGRTDSAPYNQDFDGCGSHAAITKGLFIRGKEEKEGEKLLFSPSMKNLWDGFNPIHNLGFGIDSDPRNPTSKCLRIEPWRWFYKSHVVMECSGVSKITRTAKGDDHYSTFSFGYQKWEAEEYNGLDEFLTKRRYRTTLHQIKNELTKISNFVASGYAIEITRRKGDYDSKDWRYDNDTFIICTKRGSFAPVSREVRWSNGSISLSGGLFIPEWAFIGNTIQISGSSEPSNNKQYIITGVTRNFFTYRILFSEPNVSGATETVVITPIDNGISPELGNIISPSQIIDPPTIYNFRIRPVANAMRWAPQVFSSYRNVDADKKILFMDGDGNYFAAGEMEGDCIQQLGVVKENDTIELSKFRDSTDALPMYRPERLSFEYPMTLAQFKNVMKKPYGAIVVKESCENDAGWIDEIIYTPSEGVATFTLKPAYPHGDVIVNDAVYDFEFESNYE